MYEVIVMRKLVVIFILFIGLFVAAGIGLSFMSVDVQQTEVSQTLTIQDLSASTEKAVE